VRGGLVACVLVLARVARADEVDDFVAQGEALAKQAEWTRAISAFKAADAKRPRAKHACLIGLAYTRREAWAEAELFLSVCQQRANHDDPAPDWLAEAQKTLTEKLVAAGAAPVTIAVDPPDAIALVSVSSLAPDETFAPRTIHLAPGTHTISASAPGYRPAKQEITISSGDPQTVKLVLANEHPHPAATTTTTSGGSHAGLYIAAAGGLVALGGLAFDQFSVQPARDKLMASNAQYDANKSTFESRRDIAIGMFVGAAVLATTGIVLHVTVFSGGATASVEVRR